MALRKKKKKSYKLEPIKTEVSSTDILKAVFDNNKANGNVEETIAALGAKEKLEEKKALAPIETPDDYESADTNREVIELPDSEASEEEKEETATDTPTEAPTTPQSSDLTVPPMEEETTPESEAPTAPVSAVTTPTTSPTTSPQTVNNETESKQEAKVEEAKKDEPTSPPTKSPEEISKAKQELLASREKELQDILYTIDNPGATPPKETKKDEHVPLRTPARAKSKKRNLIFNRSLSNFSIILIISGIILIGLTVILLVITSIKTRNGANITMGQKIIVRNPINNYVLTVEEVTNRVYLERVSKTSSGNGSEYFIRIKIKIKNRKKSVAAVRGTNQFRIYSTSNQYLAECYTANDLMDYNAAGAFPSSIQPKTEEEGYIYCQSDIDYFPVLEITAMKEIDKGAAQKGEIVGLSSYSYYVDLNS